MGTSSSDVFIAAVHRVDVEIRDDAAQRAWDEALVAGHGAVAVEARRNAVPGSGADLASRTTRIDRGAGLAARVRFARDVRSRIRRRVRRDVFTGPVGRRVRGAGLAARAGVGSRLALRVARSAAGRVELRTELRRGIVAAARGETRPGQCDREPSTDPVPRSPQLAFRASANTSFRSRGKPLHISMPRQARNGLPA